jgi:hypothetical protein
MEKGKYIKGFNDGYVLKRYNSRFLENILSTPTRNDYIQGLRDGKLTQEQQKLTTRTQKLKDLKSQKFKNRDLDLER